MSTAEVPELTRKDFVSDQDVRWCPGCGDYAILAQVQKVLPEIGVAKENTVFISGIGCSSRFPYYMNTYGFHSIHGRAPAIATGLKLARPDLSVWIVTGDGDGLSIGGNHLIHILRRNLDVNVLLFNNEVYGLTKGQYSPTSRLGQITKSSPMGVIDPPFDASTLALGAGATFVARTIDVETKHLQEVLHRAAAHKGTSFVEILQNCPVFNDGAFDGVSARDAKGTAQLRLHDGEALRFGADGGLGIRMRSDLSPEVVSIDEVGEDALVVHDEANPVVSQLLTRLMPPQFPVPLGVLRAVDGPEYKVYEESLEEQLHDAEQRSPGRDFDALFGSADTWTVD